jgi:hypothetical protein
MSIPFNELSGSPLESFGPKGMTAQRRLICGWSDRRELVRELLGDDYETGGTTPAYYPGSTSVVAVRIEIEPLCGDLISQDLTELTAGLNAYQSFAKVTVHYAYPAPVP